MPFTYHPPTRTKCSVCQEILSTEEVEPILDTYNGKASSANKFPFHNWYNFVLGYSPEFPEYMIKRENITKDDFVVDPFMGSGTTLACCKQQGISSTGVDANNIMVDAARVKLRWNQDTQKLRKLRDEILDRIGTEFDRFDWNDGVTETPSSQLSLFKPQNGETKDHRLYAATYRPEMLLPKYISDKPFVKATIIDQVVKATIYDSNIRELFDLALTAIIVPISNVRYGPGFGVVKPRDDVDVLGLFTEKLYRMISDLESVDEVQRYTSATVILGDARGLTDYLEPESVKLIITSPPYPGDHEYTKHTRLELIFRGHATDLKEFRTIKRRMLVASTTNIYRDQTDSEVVSGLDSITQIADLIQERLEYDRATSGFEKLYTRLVWEYFGGMYKALEQCFSVLKPGGKIALLVSDSHAFKMVHIQTAGILREIGEIVGFTNPNIVLWQLKVSTSHRYNLRENILILTKP